MDLIGVIEGQEKDIFPPYDKEKTAYYRRRTRKEFVPSFLRLILRDIGYKLKLYIQELRSGNVTVDISVYKIIPI